MNRYVLGFLFSPDAQQVALIRKTHPEWQRGRWNGIGGKIEEAEPAVAAMRRELLEETGAVVADWEFFAYMTGDDWRVSVFRAFSPAIYRVQTKTEEVVNAWRVDTVLHDAGIKLVPNLRWLIPLALDAPPIRPHGGTPCTVRIEY